MPTKFMQPGVLRKGAIRLVDPLTLESLHEERQFIYNPNMIKDIKTSEWASHKIPNMSHPVYQWGSGGERTLEFTLFVTGDRPGEPSLVSVEDEIKWYESLSYNLGKADYYPPALIELWLGTSYGGLTTQEGIFDKFVELKNQGVQTVSGFLKQNLNFTAGSMSFGFGNAVTKALGSAFPGFKVSMAPVRTLWILSKVEVRTTKWNANLEPYEAEIALVLKQYAEVSIRREQFVNSV